MIFYVLNGSNTSLSSVDKDIDYKRECYFDFITNLISHTDNNIYLSQEMYNKDIIPPISLFPIPFGISKYQKGYLKKLTIKFWKLFYK